MWAIWHWPVFFYKNSGYFEMGPGEIAGWFFSIVTGSVILTWLFNSSKGSVLACVLFHGLMEIAFTSDGAQEISMYSGIIVSVLGVLILVFGKGQDLSSQARIKYMDEASKNRTIKLN